MFAKKKHVFFYKVIAIYVCLSIMCKSLLTQHSTIYNFARKYFCCYSLQDLWINIMPHSRSIRPDFFILKRSLVSRVAEVPKNTDLQLPLQFCLSLWFTVTILFHFFSAFDTAHLFSLLFFRMHLSSLYFSLHCN